MQKTSKKKFPLNIKRNLKEEGAQAKLSMDSQDEIKVVVVTQTNFQLQVKDENWLWN